MRATARAGVFALVAVTVLSVPATLTAGAGAGTSFAAASAAALAATLASIAALLIGAVLAWLSERTRPTGDLLAVVLVAWAAPLWTGWPTGPPVVRSIGMLLTPLLLPALAAVCLSGPAGVPAFAAGRVLSRVLWSGAAAYGVARGLLRDPFLDPLCWDDCTDNVFLVHADPGLARVLDRAWLVAVACAGTGLACWAGARLVADAAGAGARRRVDVRLWLVRGPAGLALLVEAGSALVVLLRPAVDPAQSPYADLYLAGSAALFGVGVGVVASAVRSRAQARAVGRLAADLGAAPAPGSLQSWLARSWRDRELQVVFPAGTGGFVDVSGRPASPDAGPGRELLWLVRDTRPVAAVIHRPARSATDELAEHLGPAALLAIDNERLRASLLAQLTALRASRARVVESSDRERRRLERNLHDGAQQRVLAAGYWLRRARTSAAAEGGDPAAALHGLDELVAESGRVMRELRDLAQGIFPAVIDEAGLEPALQTLADQAPVAVDLDVDVRGAGPPVQVARAVYELVQTAAWAAGTPAGAAELRIRIHGDARSVVVDVDGAPVADYQRCADRIGALGGRLVRQEKQLRAEIPCE